MRTAVVAGSFDPITLGHLDIISRGSTLFDKVIIAVGYNINKKTLFDLDTRKELIRESCAGLPNIEVTHFSGLLVKFCREHKAQAILRGLRAVADFDYEFQIGLANMDMAPEIQTVFLLTDPQNIFVSSSLVKEIATHGGDVSRYVPPPVQEPLIKALERRS